MSHFLVKTVLQCKVNVELENLTHQFSVNKLHSNRSVRNGDPSHERLHILCLRWERDVKPLHDSGHQQMEF